MCEFRLKRSDFNCWKKFKTKLSEKQSTIIKHLHHQNIFVCVGIKCLKSV